jgi:O-antigen/teichoic acid export membrane protein
MIAMIRDTVPGLLFRLQGRRRLISVVLYAFMTLLPQLASGLLAILYTAAFSTEEYANYGIFAAVYAFIATVMDLGLPSGIFRNYYGSRKPSVDYFSSLISGARIVMLAAVPIGAIALYFLWDSIGVRFSQKWAFIPVLLAIAYVDRSEEVLATVCRALERPSFYAAGRLMHGMGLIIAGYIMVFVLRLGVMGALLALFAAECLALLTYEILLRRRQAIVPARADWHQLRESLRFGLPLVPDRLAGWARLLAVRPVLAHVVPAASVGLFSFASSLAAVPTLLSSGIDLALGPIYYRRREDNDAASFNSKLRRFATVYTAGLVPIWALMILFCSDVIRFVAGEAYAQAAPICSILLCATFVRMQQLFLIRQIQFLRKTWALPVITIPSALVAVVLTLVFAKDYGILAAAWVVLGVDVFIFVILACVIEHFEGLNYPLLTALVFILLISLLAAGITSGAIGPATWTSAIYRMLFIGATTVACASIWIWPNRLLIHQLVKG